MDKKEDIFDIRVEEKAKVHIENTYPLMKLIFWLGIVVEIIILVNGAIEYFRNRNISVEDDKRYFWYLRIYVVYMIVFSILAVLQSYYYLKFTRQASKSIKIKDSVGFNNSFTWMYKSIWVSLILVILNGLFFTYILVY